MTHTLGVASIGKRISGDAVLRSTFLTAADAAGLIPPSLSLPPFRLPPFLGGGQKYSDSQLAISTNAFHDDILYYESCIFSSQK